MLNGRFGSKAAMVNEVLTQDIKYIYNNFAEREKLRDAVILITGCAGFLGFYFMQFFLSYAEELGLKSIIAIDNFRLGESRWIKMLKDKYAHKVKFYYFDVTKDNIDKIVDVENIDVVIYMASIASPTFYRLYPLETLEANVLGLRRFLDYYKNKNLRTFLFFSSSEIYGDPPYDCIPTSEDYRGNVSSIGPRACYDEGKRLGEALCYIYAHKFHMPIVIVRPFNNYGPGMRLEDKRAPADFAKSIFEHKDIVIYSDGTPRRTFCYITDAIVGYLKALTYGSFDYFNIGIDKPEISMKELAQIYIENGNKIMNYSGQLRFEKSEDKEYLTHNPSRRCPNINKARKLLNYNPCIEIREGVARFLKFIKTNGVEL